MEATIVDDTALEGTEQFSITLERGSGMNTRSILLMTTKQQTLLFLRIMMMVGCIWW